MGSEPRGRGRTQCRHSVHLIYILFAVIFFLLLIVLAALNVILFYRVFHDEVRLQLYIDHYTRNWLSVAILLLTVVTLLFAIVLVLFSIYLLRRHRLVGRIGVARRVVRSPTNRFFAETTTTNTVTRSHGDNSAQRHQTRPIKLQRRSLLENIHVEKSITFH